MTSLVIAEHDNASIKPSTLNTVTAALAMGAAAAPEWATQLVGYEALLILADGTMLSTRGFPFGANA